MDSSQKVVVKKIGPLCQCHGFCGLRADVGFLLVGGGSRVGDTI